MNWPVLLTATIIPDTRAISQINDPSQRENQYLSVLKWMAKAKTDVNKIIFCENSHFDLRSFEFLHNLYLQNNRIIEIYHVPMPNTLIFYGKGWGEGIIINWALKNISSFNQCDAFIKITGRHRLLNLKRVIEIIRRGLKVKPNIKFICQSFSNKNRPHINTEFFWSDRKFYLDHIIDVHEKVDDVSGVYLEHVMAERLIDLSRYFEIAILPIPLIVHGMSGWNANPVMSTRDILREKFMQTLFPLPPLKRLICN